MFPFAHSNILTVTIFNILPPDGEGILPGCSLKSDTFQNKFAEQVGFALGILPSLLLASWSGQDVNEVNEPEDERQRVNGSFQWQELVKAGVLSISSVSTGQAAAVGAWRMCSACWKASSPRFYQPLMVSFMSKVTGVQVFALLWIPWMTMSIYLCFFFFCD